MAKRKKKGAGKGGSFERKLCKELSLWWTKDKRTDIFWRSAGSGARATVRHKQGCGTYGSYGDICAVDPIGEPFTDLFTVDAKNGYSKVHAANLIDKPRKSVQDELERWFVKAHSCHEAAGSVSWMIVHQRKGRAPVCYMPEDIFKVLNREFDSIRLRQLPKTSITLEFNALVSKGGKRQRFKVVVFPWKTFLAFITPLMIMNIARRH